MDDLSIAGVWQELLYKSNAYGRTLYEL